MTDVEEQFSKLKRSPFGGVDANDVFEQHGNMPSVPTSAVEDIGFTPEQVGFIRAGVYNAGFRTPPPEGDGVELDDLTNKLPGWSYSKVGDSIDASWEDDSSGGNITFTAVDDTLSDEVTIEQVIPVERLGNQGDVQIVRVRKTETSDVGFTIRVNAAYLDADGVVTGTEAEILSADSGSTVTHEVTPNGEAGIPTDALSLRIQVSAVVAAAEVPGDIIVVHEVSIVSRMQLAGGIGYYEIADNETTFPDDGLTTGVLADTQLVYITAIGAATRDIFGITMANMTDGRILWLYNDDSANSFILKHESGSAASASNRIRCPNGGDMTIRPFGTVQLMYFGLPNGTTRRWHVMSHQ
jgi:hypothetical protein